jgi:hypothetical protein
MIESLEGRTLFSAAPMNVAALATPASPGQHAALSLGGTLTGTFTLSTSPKLGTTYSLKGSGTLGGLGAITITGSIKVPPTGGAGGQLLVKNSKGSFGLSLAGLKLPGPAKLPRTLTYVIKAGTGAYVKLSGIGSVNVTFAPGNQFTLKLTSGSGGTTHKP